MIMQHFLGRQTQMDLTLKFSLKVNLSEKGVLTFKYVQRIKCPFKN